MEDEDGSGELVPVLYVSKNGIGIRSIFLHDPNSEENEGNLVEEKILMVGRHLDCHIVVNHPSTNRWNLQIQLHKSSQWLLLTDLSSVHGTWVCVERATPQVR
jgi:pSer/pThr/pTyr-binding forkhead associated (FHA) protein